MPANAGAWQDLRLRDGGEAVLSDATTGLYRFDEMRIEGGGTLLIDGDVELLITVRLEIRDGGAIVLADDASSLTLYLMDELAMDGGAIGVDAAVAAESEKKIAMITKYSDPRRVRVFGVSSASGGAAAPQYTLQDSSIMLASVHAPTALMTIASDSIFVGRATTGSLRVSGSSEVYCDPSLGVPTGFTDLAGPLYDGDGELIEEVAEALADWDDTMGMQALVDHVLGYLDLGDVLDEVLGKLPLGGGGGEEDPEPTDRVAARVAAREWPMRAFAMESINRPKTAPDGYDIEPGYNDDGSFIDLGKGGSLSIIVTDLQLNLGSQSGGAKSLAGIGEEDDEEDD